MKFVKEEDEERMDYVFQKNKKTKFSATFIIIVLAILIIAVVATGFYMEIW